MPACVKAIGVQEFVWWDVGWKKKFEKFPITGYMWATLEKEVKYIVSIEFGKTVKQPDKTLAKEVEANGVKLGLPSGKNDRLHEYLNNERDVLTLLKLSSIEELKPPLELSDFTLWNGKPLSTPPRSCAQVRLR